MHWKLFEELYAAHAKRRAVERIHAQRNATIAGVWGNPNFDDGKERKGARKQMINTIDDNVQRAIRKIYGQEQEFDIDQEDPFFGKMEVPELDTAAAVSAKYDVEELDQLS